MTIFDSQSNKFEQPLPQEGQLLGGYYRVVTEGFEAARQATWRDDHEVILQEDGYNTPEVPAPVTQPKPTSLAEASADVIKLAAHQEQQAAEADQARVDQARRAVEEANRELAA
ncbi:MAG TPA: hypothetical protein VLG37_00220 [Candidatus Saccharimonadales bacterium]|nr:hypothetical protein [Candidatus Saccharimonadales bacterium]